MRGFDYIDVNEEEEAETPTDTNEPIKVEVGNDDKGIKVEEKQARKSMSKEDLMSPSSDLHKRDLSGTRKITHLILAIHG